VGCQAWAWRWGLRHVRSILQPVHSAAISGLIRSHNPDLFCLTETCIKHISAPPALNLPIVHLLTILFSVFHVLSTKITLKLPLAALPFLFVNLSHSYHPTKTASHPLNLHQLLSSYLAPKYLFSMSIAHLQVPTTLNQTLFFLMSLILSYHLPPLHLTNLSSQAISIFMSIAVPIILLLSFFHCSPRSTLLSMYTFQLTKTTTLLT